MKVAIYNKSAHIRTLGGGEKVMAQFVKGLMDEHDVTLISEEEVDLKPFIKKFNTDITKVKFVALPSEMELSEYTKNFDVFINTSHNVSTLLGKAKHNILYISFPKKILLKAFVLNSFLNNILKRFFSAFLTNQIDFELQGKFLMLDQKYKSIPVLRVFKYNILGNFLLTFANTKLNEISLNFDKQLPEEKIKSDLEIFFGDKKIDFSTTSNSIIIKQPSTGQKIINLDFKTKNESLFKGINVYSLTSTRTSKTSDSIFINFCKLFKRLLSFKDFIDSYQQLLANSIFTKSWTRVYWNRDAEVLYPPSEIEANNPESSKRENKIITIGRFFEDEHNKKHIPMILAFRKLIDENRLQNWELHMCGGSMEAKHNKKYLRKVKYLAQGYPIFIHEDIPFKDMTELLAKSKLFWHAAGFGEDENVNPIKMEHFGIVPVEAMCSGVIPLLVNKAGLRETVEHDKSGYLWNTLDELGEYTVKLSKDENLIVQMRKNAIARAKAFNTEAFDKNLKEIIKKVNEIKN